MFVVTEADAAAIRSVYEQDGESDYKWSKLRSRQMSGNTKSQFIKAIYTFPATHKEISTEGVAYEKKHVHGSRPDEKTAKKLLDHLELLVQQHCKKTQTAEPTNVRTAATFETFSRKT